MKTKLFKNKIQMVIYIILFIFWIFLAIYISKVYEKKDFSSDAEKFSNIYPLIEKKNLYVFSDATEVLNILNGRSGVILLGFPENKWTTYYAEILNDTAKEVGIDKIYYYDFLNDRTESHGTYETICNILEVYLPVNDLGKKEIYAPSVLIVKNGNVLAYFDDNVLMKGNINPDSYYDKNGYALVYSKFKTALLNYKGE